MYYDERKRRRTPERVPVRHHHPFRTLVKWLFYLAVLLLVGITALYMVPVSWLGQQDAAAFLAGTAVPGSYTHILLLGVDQDANGTSRSDTLIIASVGTGGVRLTSLMRDTMVAIPGREGTYKLNSAYAFGGVELAVQTVNQNFDLAITRYIVVDFESFPTMADAVGGIEIAVTEAEMAEVNKNVYEQYAKLYKAGKIGYEEGLAAYERDKLTQYGEHVHLDGMQALGFSRIRKIDSDFGRTGRQRQVLEKILARAKACITQPQKLFALYCAVRDNSRTNMNAAELGAIGAKALAASGIEQLRLPAEGTYTDNGSSLEGVDFAANRQKFLDFLK